MRSTLRISRFGWKNPPDSRSQEMRAAACFSSRPAVAFTTKGIKRRNSDAIDCIGRSCIVCVFECLMFDCTMCDDVVVVPVPMLACFLWSLRCYILLVD